MSTTIGIFEHPLDDLPTGVRVFRTHEDLQTWLATQPAVTFTVLADDENQDA